MLRYKYTVILVLVVIGLFGYRHFTAEPTSLVTTGSTYMSAPITVLLNPDGSIPWEQVSRPSVCSGNLFSWPIHSYSTDSFVWWFTPEGDFGVTQRYDIEFGNETLFYIYLHMEMQDVLGREFYVREYVHKTISQSNAYATVANGCVLAVVDYK